MSLYEKTGIIQTGDIGFSRSPGFVQACIRFFTISRLTHSFLITRACDQMAVLEAGALNVQLVDYTGHYRQKPDVLHWVYRPRKVTAEEAASAISRTFTRFAGENYGWLQLPWFMLRFGWLILTRRKFRIPNPFPGGIICSELVWHYLLLLGGEYAALARSFTPNEVNAADLETMFLAHPDLFDIVLTPGILGRVS